MGIILAVKNRSGGFAKRIIASLGVGRQGKKVLIVEAASRYSSTASSVIHRNGGHFTEMPLDELYPPEFHPFQVRDDEAMQRLINSVNQYGVREPGLACS